MMKTEKNNYDIAKARCAEDFAKIDSREACKILGFAVTENEISATLLGTAYRIDRKTGKVWAGEHLAGFEPAMALYDLLSRDLSACHAAGTYCRTESLPGLVRTAAQPSENSLLIPYTHKASKNIEKFAVRCKAIGGEEYGRGDVSFRFCLFGDVYAVVQFWEADEDFPAQLQVLWDGNILDFFKYETVWYVAFLLMEKIFGE